jgi:hypothetical protein
MSQPQPIPLGNLASKLPGKVDIFICSASFESRCRSVPDSVDPGLFGWVFVAIDEGYPSVAISQGEYLLSRYVPKSSIVSLHRGNPLITADSLNRAILSCASDQPRSYLADITTFTHEALLILVKLLQLRLKPEDSVTFVYTAASEYSIGQKPEEKWLSKGIGEIRSVLGYPGKVLPSRKSHLLILAGYESERAERFIEQYEPNVLSVGLGAPDSATNPAHASINKVMYNRIVAQHKEARTFLFSCSDPLETRGSVQEQIQQVRDHNVLIAPMNTKISTIGAALVALEDDSVQLCYAPAHQYNEIHYSRPDTNCFLFSVPGIPLRP